MRKKGRKEVLYWLNLLLHNHAYRNAVCQIRLMPDAVGYVILGI